MTNKLLRMGEPMLDAIFNGLSRATYGIGLGLPPVPDRRSHNCAQVMANAVAGGLPQI